MHGHHFGAAGVIQTETARPALLCFSQQFHHIVVNDDGIGISRFNMLDCERQLRISA